jgi:hypothetical protein
MFKWREQDEMKAGADAELFLIKYIEIYFN